MMRNQEMQAQIEKIQNLVEYFEQQPDSETRNRVLELLQALMDLHGNCLGHIISVIADHGTAGQEILGELSKDETVSGLLILYGLHPAPLQDRVQEAIEKLSHVFKPHNASIELLAIDEGAVRLRFTANGDGCHSSPATLREIINNTMLGAAPDITDLIIDEVAPEPKLVFVPLESLGKTRAAAKGNGQP